MVKILQRRAAKIKGICLTTGLVTMKSIWCVLFFLLIGCSVTLKQTAIPIASSTPTLLRIEITTPYPEMIQLPKPKEKGTLTLEETLVQRRSIREFSDKLLTLDDLSQLLWAAQGITNQAGHRTSPSAGALYPLEVYAVIPDGVYHYEPHGHKMKLHMPGDVRSDLCEAALSQDAVLNAPVVIVIAGVYARTAQKYGEERSLRYVHLEAGHAAQNILLQAVALKLGAVPIGAFYDDDVTVVLHLPSNQSPLYLIPIGHPK